MKTTEYLDAIKERYELGSDYQLAKKLGIRQTRISNYRHGTSKFDEAMAIRVAGLLNIHPGAVLADIAAERTHDQNARREWLRVSELLRRTAAAVAMVSVTSGAVIYPGQDTQSAESVQFARFTELYIMRNWRVLILALKSQARFFFVLQTSILFKRIAHVQ